MNVTDIQQLGDKTIVQAFRGRLKAKYPRSSGVNSKGPWSVQNLVLEDFVGGSIKVAVWGKDEIPFPEGVDLILQSHIGPKGTTGLYVSSETYQGVVSTCLRATGSCHIGSADQMPAPPAPAPAPPAPAPAYQQQPAAPAYQQQPAAPAHSAELTEAKRALVQIANLHLLCCISVERINAPLYCELTGTQMSESQRQAAAASVFIKAERDGLVRKMPSTPFKAEDLRR